jgi:5,5'-dehydrodivanillate O-demethylase oxygenase subunit
MPVDDEHTLVYVVYFEPSDQIRTSADAEVPVEPFAHKSPEGVYFLDKVLAQDAMAWETQGALFDRTKENLGASDRGIVMYRRMLRDQIEAVHKGKAPLGCVASDKQRAIIEIDVINERIGVGSYKGAA